jgi:predicted DNA-binding transcriptional regulator AlpA
MGTRSATDPRRPHLALAVGLEAPKSRGRLLTAAQVAEILGLRPDWVKRNVPGKVTLGHSTVRWFELDVIAWLNSKRETKT